MECIFLANVMLYNIKALNLHCVFHGIRFKVNNEDWLSVMDSLFFAPYLLLNTSHNVSYLIHFLILTFYSYFCLTKHVVQLGIKYVDERFDKRK